MQAVRSRAQSSRPRPAPTPVRLPGGTFLMGSDRHYPEEGPSHMAQVRPFAIDPYPVTNAEYARFVEETGYRTVAERPLDPALYPGATAEALLPGSLVFRKTRGPTDLRDFRNWWVWTSGAFWRQPEGPGTSVRDRADHPVVHIAFEDAQAYAEWSGKALPSEAEWEYAARGGLEGAEYAWGDAFAPDGQMMANTWWGEFPYRRVRTRGYERTSPVGSFLPNGYGLHDMIGNVWEWTTGWFTSRHVAPASRSCCGDGGSRSAEERSRDPNQPAIRIPRRVVKGGSFLCSPSYCRRYRPAARHAQMVDSGMSHIGFRCVTRPEHQLGDADHD